MSEYKEILTLFDGEWWAMLYKKQPEYGTSRLESRSLAKILKRVWEEYGSDEEDSPFSRP